MKISEMIKELQEILNEEGDLEIYEEYLNGWNETDWNGGEESGLWYSISPVIRYKENITLAPGNIELPEKFVSLE